MDIVVSSLFEMMQHVGRVSHVISIVDEEDIEFIPSLRVPKSQRLVLTCHDVDSVVEAKRRMREMPGSKCTVPTRSLVGKALAFAKTMSPDARLLIHCGHGISRSTAIAFAVLCQSSPETPEAENFQRLKKLRPSASPNKLMVKFADQLLRRDGKMVRALEPKTPES